MSGVAQKQLNSQQIRLVAVCTVCLLLSTTVIALRLLARRASGVKFWWDDHVAILALVRRNIFFAADTPTDSH